MLEAASVEPDPDRRKRMLTFVVAGGGCAGVETVGGPVILPELGQRLVRYAEEKLREDPESGQPYPPTAQHALRGGRRA